MSGHSKWKTIKRQKGTTDAKKGQLFTKLSSAIYIAVKEGGGVTDPESNYKLRIAVDRARAASMPKESIERALEKAKGGASGDYHEALYEGFGPGGIAVLVQAVTDNKQRTISEVKNAFEKNGASLGGQGSVAYLFEQKGELVIRKDGKSSDELLEVALNAGAQDIEEDEESAILYTQISSLIAVKNAIEAAGFTVESAELIFKPKTVLNIDQKDQDKAITFLEKIEDLGDVQKVFTNAKI